MNKYQKALNKIVKSCCPNCDTEGCKDCQIEKICNATAKDWVDTLQELVDKAKQPTGETSDGYHTFNELYYHRTVLFSIICNANKEKAYKSRLHSDGTMYDDMFITVINTPKGQYSYHCENKYWNLFDIHIRDKAEEWDGHQPKDIERLYSLYDELVNPLEEVKKEWEELGYKVKVDHFPYVIVIRGSSDDGDNIIYLFLKDKTISFGEYSRFSIKEHKLLTKTFKALGWEV